MGKGHKQVFHSKEHKNGEKTFVKIYKCISKQ